MHVLVVSNDHFVRSALQQTLQADGHTCEQASDLGETLGRLRAKPAEIVMIDCTPAGIDGVALCQRIRAQVRGMQPHLLVMLAAAEIGHSHAVLAAGADDWLISSDDATTVLARLAVAQRMLQQKTDLWRLQGGAKSSQSLPAPATTLFEQRLRQAGSTRPVLLPPVPDLTGLARLADKLSMPIAYIDQTLRLAFFNTAYASDPFGEFRTPPYIGASLQDVIGVPAFETLRAEINCALSAIPVHFTCERGQGEHGKLLDVSYFPDIDRDAQVLGFFSVTLDVTAERATAATVEWQELLLQGLADAMQMPCTLLDGSGCILFHNDAFAALQDRHAGSLRGMPVKKLMSQAFCTQHTRSLAAALAGQFKEVIVVEATPVGIERWTWTYTPQRDAANIIVGVWCNVTAIAAALPAISGRQGERRRPAG